MGYFQGLHGTVALFILCSLLFAEEAGVPLPFAPGEITLIVAGLLIAAGGLNPFLFFPFAIAACIGGELLGYSWASMVGPRSLQAVAERLHQGKPLERVESRLRSADARTIGISRLIPGLRIYTTLVAGAVGVRRRTFLLGTVPATVVWVAIFVALGALVGVPVEHLFNQVARLALQGGILLVIGVGGYFAVRRIPTSDAAGVVALPRWMRVTAATLIDVGVVASIVTGLLSIGRRVFGLGLRAGWLDAIVALVVITVFYVYVTRRSTGGTVGESLLRTTYATGHQIPLGPRSALHAARQHFARSDNSLHSSAEILRALGDPHRLLIVTRLMDGPSGIDTLVSNTTINPTEVQHDLSRLQTAGVITSTGPGPGGVYELEPRLIDPISRLLRANEEARQAEPPTEPAESS